jgi:hypothetical protein
MYKFTAEDLRNRYMIQCINYIIHTLTKLSVSENVTGEEVMLFYTGTV